MRREERDRCITPIVDKPWPAVLDIELKDGQQFHCADPELLKVRDLLDQSPVRAADLLINAGTGVKREPSHMHLIYDRQGRWSAEWFIAFPVVCQRIDHNALHRSYRVVASLTCSISSVISGDNYPAAI